MNVYGELIKAQLENLTADPTLGASQAGKIWMRTDLSIPKIDVGGSADQFVLAAAAQTLTNKVITLPVPNLQTFISGSGTYGCSYWFTVSSANATAAATYTNNGHTFTVVATIAAGTKLLCTSTGAPAASGTLTKSGGTGDSTITFSLAQAPIYIKVKMVGGGGGGGGGAAGGAGTAATDGGVSTFGSSLLTANGGAHGGQGTGSPGGVGGAGGSATLGGTPGIGIPGGSGTFGLVSTNNSGMPGGSSAFGGAGGGGGAGAAGNAATTNSGSGGGGGGGAGGVTISGGGGGAGGYVEAIIVNPASTYSYGVGAAGSAGAGNSSGGAGGAGAAGIILVEEFFQ